jgi:hypothetical protein
MGSAGGDLNPWLRAISALDITQAFKTKGDLKRWSAKRTIGGAIVAEALWQIHEFGLSWEGIVLCGVGVTPLCLSFFEKE